MVVRSKGWKGRKGGVGRAGGLTAAEWDEAWRENEKKYGLDIEKWPQEAQAALLKRWNVLDADQYKRYNISYLTNWLRQLRDLPQSHPETWIQDLQTLHLTELSNRVQRWRIEETKRKQRFEKEQLKLLTFQKIEEGSYTHILGPVSFTEHYSPTMDKQILVFGDIHFYGVSCDNKNLSDGHLPFLDLVEYLVTHGPKEEDHASNDSLTKVDVFLETPYRNDPGRREDQRDVLLGEFARRFPGCFLMSKEGCAYSSFARFHYLDVRFRSDILSKALPGMFDPWDKRFNVIRSQLAGAQKFAKAMNQSNLADLKIPKQYENVYPVTLRLRIQLWFTEQIKLLGDELLALDFETYYLAIVKLVNESEEKKAHAYLDKHGIGKTVSEAAKIYTIDSGKIKGKNFSDPVERLFNWTAERTSAFHVLFMDYYAIGRLFRSYPDGAQVAKRSIIFAGEYHADNYRRIFDMLGFERVGQPAIDSATSFQCIQINRPIRWRAIRHASTTKHPKPTIEQNLPPSKRIKRSAKANITAPPLPPPLPALQPRKLLPPPPPLMLAPPALRNPLFHMTLRPRKPLPPPFTLPPPPPPPYVSGTPSVLPPPPYVTARPTTSFAASNNT